MPGRHAAPAGPSFYRDLLTMLGGILAVGIIVYLGLSALSTTDSPGPVDTTESASTTPTPLTTAAPLTTTTRAATTTTAPPTTTSTTAALRPPSAIVVRVLNAVGTAGLASDVSSALQGLGYQILEPGNFQQLAQSRVWYVEGFEAEALELALQFPDALVEPTGAGGEEEADIVVVLGQSYEG